MRTHSLLCILSLSLAACGVDVDTGGAPPAQVLGASAGSEAPPQQPQAQQQPQAPAEASSEPAAKPAVVPPAPAITSRPAPVATSVPAPAATPSRAVLESLPLHSLKYLLCESNDRNLFVDLSHSDLLNGDYRGDMTWVRLKDETKWEAFQDPLTTTFTTNSTGTSSMITVKNSDNWMEFTTEDFVKFSGESKKSGRKYTCEQVSVAPEGLENKRFFDCGSAGWVRLDSGATNWVWGSIRADFKRRGVKRVMLEPYNVSGYPIFNEYDGWTAKIWADHDFDYTDFFFVFLPKSAQQPIAGQSYPLTIFDSAPNKISDPAMTQAQCVYVP